MRQDREAESEVVPSSSLVEIEVEVGVEVGVNVGLEATFTGGWEVGRS